MRVKAFCFCIDLRIGCIIMAIVGLIFPISGISLHQGWGIYTSIVSAIVANGCLLYSAAYIQGSTNSRIIAVLIYIVIVVLSAIFFVVQAILWYSYINCDGYWYSNCYAEENAFLAITIIYCLLDLYFILVAYSFYKELNKHGNIKLKISI